MLVSACYTAWAAHAFFTSCRFLTDRKVLRWEASLLDSTKEDSLEHGARISFVLLRFALSIIVERRQASINGYPVVASLRQNSPRLSTSYITDLQYQHFVCHSFDIGFKNIRSLIYDENWPNLFVITLCNIFFLLWHVFSCFGKLNTLGPFHRNERNTYMPFWIFQTFHFWQQFGASLFNYGEKGSNSETFSFEQKLIRKS